MRNLIWQLFTLAIVASMVAIPSTVQALGDEGALATEIVSVSDPAVHVFGLECGGSIGGHYLMPTGDEESGGLGTLVASGHYRSGLMWKAELGSTFNQSEAGDEDQQKAMGGLYGVRVAIPLAGWQQTVTARVIHRGMISNTEYFTQPIASHRFLSLHVGHEGMVMTTRSPGAETIYNPTFELGLQLRSERRERFHYLVHGESKFRRHFVTSMVSFGVDVRPTRPTLGGFVDLDFFTAAHGGGGRVGARFSAGHVFEAGRFEGPEPGDLAPSNYVSLTLTAGISLGATPGPKRGWKVTVE